MTWIARFALVCLFVLPPAFADNVVDITGQNLAIEGSLTLNFSLQFDATTDKVIGTPAFSATGTYANQMNFSQLAFQSAGPSYIDFSGPSLTGGTTLLSLGVNGLSPTVPADLTFPMVGTYGAEIVLCNYAAEGYAGTVTVSAMPSSTASAAEPSVGLLLLLGLLAAVGVKMLPFKRSAAFCQ